MVSGGGWEHQNPTAAGTTHLDLSGPETLLGGGAAPSESGRFMGDSMAEETRVIYHLEDQDTPYLIRINVPAQRVTLADFRQALNKPNFRFFFKSVDDDFG